MVCHEDRSLKGTNLLFLAGRDSSVVPVIDVIPVGAVFIAAAT